MKILRFDLVAFGHFTDLRLDLSHGREGVHLIFGPNEAGKSTALRALRALFYGIDPRSPDGFLHGYDKLRVGALIKHSDGSEVEFIRRKGSKNTFLNRDGKAVDESPLTRCLGSVDEKLFTSLFGINHERLVAGGQSILQGGGDAGQSLFSAGFGGTSLRAVLDGLEEEASRLFRPQGQNQVINRACKEYAEIKRRIGEFSLAARDYEQHVEALSCAKKEKERAGEDLKCLRIALSRLERIKRALPLLSQRRALLADLEGRRKVVLLPHSFSEERAKAVAALEGGLTMRKRGTDAIAALDGRISRLNVPEELIGRAAAIVELHQRLGSYRKAAADLPRLEGEVRALDLDANELLDELRPGLPLEQARSLQVGRLKRILIQDLANQRQALFDQLAAAKRTLEKTSGELRAAEVELASLGNPADTKGLRAAIRLAQKEGDLEEKLTLAHKALRTAHANAARDLKKLSLWTGDLGSLEAMPVPSGETLDRFEREWSEAEQNGVEVSLRLDDAVEEIARCERSIEELLLKGSIPSEADLQEARDHREKGWQLIRGIWLEALEESDEVRDYSGGTSLEAEYEVSVQRSDELADRLRREAEAVATQAQLKAAHHQQTQKRAALSEELKSIEAQSRTLREKWAAQWPGITPLPPREMRAWLQKQTRLAEQAVSLRHDAATVADIEHRISKHSEALAQVLGALDEKELQQSLSSLIDRSERVADRLDAAGQKRTLIAEQISTLFTARKAALSEKVEAEQNLAVWQTQWHGALHELGLADSTSPPEANEFIACCTELIKKLDETDKLRVRIAGIRSDAAAFSEEAMTVFNELAFGHAVRNVEEAVIELHASLSKARTDSTMLSGLKQQRAAAEIELRQVQDSIAAAQQRLAAMCQQAGCRHHEELEAIEQSSCEVREKRQKLEQIDERLLVESAGAPLEAFLGEIGMLDEDSLGAQITEMQNQITARDNEKSEIGESVGRAEASLEAMDGNSLAAEAAEKAEEVLAQIEEESERFIRLRIAAALLRREVERYRSENQDPLLRRAGKIFCELTRNSFSAITADFDENDTPVLMGVRPSNSLVTVQGMSDGVRDQLFLALQLASVEKFIGSSEPLPFIVDDVLIAFDQDREAAVLNVLAQLSKFTQVIIFTHHWHLVELAQRTLPSSILSVHELKVPSRP